MKFKRLQKILIIFLITIVALKTNSFAEETNSSDIIVDYNSGETLILERPSLNSSANAPNLYSESAILMDSNTGSILYSKNINKKAYPASTTKILTAIVAIENGNLSDIATTTRQAIIVIPSGYASAYLSEGEQISLEQLLELLLVHSANDAANVIAEHISGSVDSFVELMNKKAQDIGCTNTHFVNTNGIHNENHYTTAYDLALIARYCMKNETFRRIVSMQSCTIQSTNKSGERTYVNTNDLINPKSSYYYEYCIGGKTGYTSQAKNCLISFSNKNNLELISVVLNALQTENGQSARNIDSTKLFEYGYNTYSNSVIAKQYDIVGNIDVPNGTSKTKNLDLLLANDINSLVDSNSQNEISYEIKIDDNLSAPLAANSIVGTITYHVGNLTHTENLLASHNVEENNIMLWFLRALLTIILLIITLCILLKIIGKKKRF